MGFPCKEKLLKKSVPAYIGLSKLVIELSAFINLCNLFVQWKSNNIPYQASREGERAFAE